jgi:hypothetical protein
MDSSFLVILFYAFIFYLVIRSIFKKKPTEKGKTEAPIINKTEDEYKENDNPDVIQEIEKLIKDREAKTKNPYLDKPEVIDNNLSNKPEKVVPFIDESAQKANKDLVSNEVKILDSYMEEEANKFETLLSLKRKSEEPVVKNLKEKINNKNLLKEYFIISEILGKPKALRR